MKTHELIPKSDWLPNETLRMRRQLQQVLLSRPREPQHFRLSEFLAPERVLRFSGNEGKIGAVEALVDTFNGIDRRTALQAIWTREREGSRLFPRGDLARSCCRTAPPSGRDRPIFGWSRQSFEPAAQVAHLDRSRGAGGPDTSAPESSGFDLGAVSPRGRHSETLGFEFRTKSSASAGSSRDVDPTDELAAKSD